MEDDKTTPSGAAKLREVSALLLGRATSDVRDLAPARLAGCTAAELRQAARMLGLSVDDSVALPVVAAEVARALVRLMAPVAPAPASGASSDDADASAREADVMMRSKFDVGQERRAEAPRHIPWSYGQDRVTAMVVNPQALFVYWEVTDPAIEQARLGLGPAGGDAWLNLRVYDVSGRIFDGTNALSYADYRVERGDRQWFVEVGRPGSTAIVDLGMRSSEGYFVKIVRSGRADFPRHGRIEEGSIEWLTVRSATGEAGQALVGGPPIPTFGGAGSQGRGGGNGQAGAGGQGGSTGEQLWRLLTERWWAEGKEVIRREWIDAGRTFEWVGPLIRTTWEAGPFPIPVEAPRAATERYEGPVAVYSVDGQTRVVFGPWQVVIRGLSGWAERRVIARWEIYTSWVVGEGVLRELQARRISPLSLAPGASEALLLGASEQRWLFGSELRLAGASEVFFLGASELRMLGASETLLLGGSETRLAGASEWRLAGASEWRYAGASEWQSAGASEQRALGASELRLGGASEAAPPPPFV